MSNKGFDELERRGFIQQCTNLDFVKEKLNNQKVTFYCGFDPTGASLHVGHLVPLFAMAHLHNASHRAIALVGGGTARIGDPSGKTEMRKILPVDQIRENALKMKEQMSHFIDFNTDDALLLDNADWLTNLNYIEFLRDIGQFFSVNRMLSFETYKIRLETGLSFIEFNYQLLQSYDFLILHERYGCELQIGGDDQWGNIVSGTDLIRRAKGADAFGLTFPLVTRADGKKMGKTEKGALYLDPDMISPYEFFQYWRNVPDQDVEKFLLLYTFLPVEEIKELGALKDKEINRAKEVLSFELTKIVHGEEQANKALEASKTAFTSISEKDGTTDTSAIPSLEISRKELENGIGAIELFARTELCTSKGAARRLISQGGARINDKKIEDQYETIDLSWEDDDILMLRAGKKRYFKIIITDEYKIQ